MTQTFANLAWSCALLPCVHFPLFKSIGSCALPVRARYRTCEFSSTAWSAATLRYPDIPLIDATAAVATRSASEITCQHIANSAFALAHIEYYHAHFLAAIAG